MSILVLPAAQRQKTQQNPHRHHHHCHQVQSITAPQMIHRDRIQIPQAVHLSFNQIRLGASESSKYSSAAPMTLYMQLEMIDDSILLSNNFLTNLLKRKNFVNLF